MEGKTLQNGGFSWENCRINTVRPKATLSMGILKHSVARNSVTGGLYVFSEGYNGNELVQLGVNTMY